MNPSDDLLSRDAAGDAVEGAARTTGILPSQELERQIRVTREIRSVDPVLDDQIQPASLDLRLGAVAYRVRASFLPGRDARVETKLEDLAMHRMDISGGAVLERGCVFIIPLQEALVLRKRTSAMGNPKSSTGRLDIFTRLITDYGTEFDRVKMSSRPVELFGLPIAEVRFLSTRASCSGIM